MLASAIVAILSSQPGTFPFRNPDLPIQVRVKDLLGRLTLEEKVSQMVHESAAIPRLGIPRYGWWNEALHGVARNGLATVFPQSIGLAATFDDRLMFQIATAISDEGRAKFRDEFRRTGGSQQYAGLTFWSPNINIFRDPRWGRGQETFGEDPYLTSRMGVAFVKGMQGTDPHYLKTVATPKHFAVHSGPDPLRHQFDARVGGIDLWNTYLPAFEACITEGGAWSIMSSYNRVNGEAASASPTLLGKILRGRWGFPGYVVSDCGAVGDILYGHKLVKTPAEAAALAEKAGCDLECGQTYGELVNAVHDGLLTEADIDRDLSRLIEAKIRLGLFDPPSRVPFSNLPMSLVDSRGHRALAKDAARKSLVMLKNDGLLPLKRRGTIAVIGPNADEKETLWGNYNGIPSYTVTPLEGIRRAAGSGMTVTYTKGSGLTSLGNLVPIPPSALRSASGDAGLDGEYFTGMTVSGPALTRRLDSKVDFAWGEASPGKGMPADRFSVRWTGTLIPPASGVYRLGARVDDGVRIYLDGKLIVEDWKDGAPRLKDAEVRLEGGRKYALKVEYYENGQGAEMHLLWQPPVKEAFEEAVAAAKKADVVVAVLGISTAIEEEELDRTAIDLPQVQRNLLAALAKTGKPIVTVLVNGGPISSPLLQASSRAVFESWYGGQEAGTAVGEALFGDLNPSGRLPVTVYRSFADLPPFADYSMKGRTYRYFAGKPLYPFGFGLSYTQFAYSGLQLPKTLVVGKPLGVDVTVRNSGKRAGDEVVQLYLSRSGENVPLKELKAFARVAVPAGSSRRVHLLVPPEQLAFRDADGWRWVRPGTLKVLVGGGQPGTSAPTVTGSVALIGKAVRLPQAKAAGRR